MANIGYIDILAYTSDAQIPLENVAVTITATDGMVLSMRLTNRNGSIEPIEIQVPNISAGQTPNTGILPFTAVNVYARLDGYEQIENKDVQIFPETVTRLNLQMIPLSEFPSSWDKAVIYLTPKQNL